MKIASRHLVPSLILSLLTLAACSGSVTKSKGINAQTSGSSTQNDAISALQSGYQASLSKVEASAFGADKICQYLKSGKPDELSDDRAMLVHSSVRKLFGQEAKTALSCLQAKTDPTEFHHQNSRCRGFWEGRQSDEGVSCAN